MIDIEIEPGGGVQKIFDLLQRRIWLGPLILLLALLAGLGLGLLIGWGIAPVNWTPNADDVRAIADSYALNNDLPLAKSRLQNVPPAEQIRLFSKVIADSAARNRPFEAERATALMQALGLTPGSTAPTPTPSPVPVLTPSLTSLGPILIGAVVLLGLALLAGGGFFFIRVALPRLRAARSRPASEMETEPDADESSPLDAPAVSASPASATLGTLGRVQAVYTAGMDNFDSSFPLETPKQGFLGECGIGVSETVGDGLPDKVTAFDLWLFDKTDVRTVTQILMSEHAFNDQTIRSKLQTKGDIVFAEKGHVFALETQSLKIEARIQDLVYASNPNLPTNSYFQKFVVEIATYLK